MNECPYCHSTARQVKNGRNPSGSQRMKCQGGGRVYTPEPSPNGYDETARTQALRMYPEGMSLRAIGRIFGVSPQSVTNRIRAHAAQLPEAPRRSAPEVAEIDEMFIFVGQKKSLLPRADR